MDREADGGWVDLEGWRRKWRALPLWVQDLRPLWLACAVLLAITLPILGWWWLVGDYVGLGLKGDLPILIGLTGVIFGLTFMALPKLLGIKRVTSDETRWRRDWSLAAVPLLVVTPLIGVVAPPFRVLEAMAQAEDLGRLAVIIAVPILLLGYLAIVFTLSQRDPIFLRLSREGVFCRTLGEDIVPWTRIEAIFVGSSARDYGFRLILRPDHPGATERVCALPLHRLLETPAKMAASFAHWNPDIAIRRPKPRVNGVLEAVADGYIPPSPPQ